jgi:putative DNA primase/helicase
MLDGLQLWLKGKIEPPDSVRESSKDYRDENDLLPAFFKACCVFGTDYWVATSEFRQTYEAWCHEEGGGYPLSAERVAKQLKEKGCCAKVSKVNGTSARVWSGIGLL